MKAKLLALLLVVTFLSGCYGINKMRFYAVKDPAAQAPSPAFIAKMKGGSYSGEISVVLPDGETCKGPWTRVSREPNASGASVAATAEGMPAVWDKVYGQGFYLAHVLGKYVHGTAVVTGDRGTVLNVEFVGAEETEPGRGVARDNNANVYKVVIDP